MTAPSLFDVTGQARNPRVRLGTALYDPAAPTLQELAQASQDPGEVQDTGGSPSLQQVLSAPNRNLGAITIPTPPTLASLPVRDLGAEAHRAGDAALVGGLFGLGLGRVGNVSAAPTLAAVAAQGSQEGADQRYQTGVHAVQLQNQQAQQTYQDQLKRLQLQEEDARRRGTEFHQSDELERQKAKAKADYMASLAGLPEDQLQTKLENDFRSGVHDALGFQFGKRENGSWDVAPVKDPAQETRDANARSMEDARVGDDRRRFIMTLAGMSPQGRQSALALMAGTGESERLKLNLIQDENGVWGIPGVDLEHLDRALPASMTPEGLAATEQRDRARAGRAAALEGVKMLSHFATDPRLDAPTASDIPARVTEIQRALIDGEVPDASLFEIPEGALAKMSPYQLQTLADAQERLGLAKSAQKLRERAVAETARHNKVTESATANKPSASLTAAQTQYEGLVAQGKQWQQGQNQASQRAAAAQAKLKAIQALPQYQGIGGQADAMNAPGYWDAFHEWQAADLEATRYGNLMKETEKQQAQIEARWPALAQARQAGAASSFGAPRTVTSPGGKTYQIKKVN